mmetsp:Transcript_7198/g.16155  ORF Transcript_7198/g.16155 Transcript_7198/m.16155 type:complete len:205 (-) Transcript_7198:919-1533(-)
MITRRSKVRCSGDIGRTTGELSSTVEEHQTFRPDVASALFSRAIVHNRPMRAFANDRWKRFFDVSLLLRTALNNLLTSCVFINRSPSGNFVLNPTPKFRHGGPVHEVRFNHTSHFSFVLHSLGDWNGTFALFHSLAFALADVSCIFCACSLGARRHFFGASFSFLEHGDGHRVDIHPKRLPLSRSIAHIVCHVFIRLDVNVCLR